MTGYTVPFQIGLRYVGKTCGDAPAGKVGRLAEVAVIGHANREPPVAHPQFQSCQELDARLVDEVATGDAEVDRPFTAQHRNVVGPQKRNLDRHVADPREQRPLLAAELQTGFVQELSRPFGESALARNTY